MTIVGTLRMKKEKSINYQKEIKLAVTAELKWTKR